MKFTKEWLNDHLKTSKTEAQIIEKLNSTGLEVEKVEPIKSELSDFVKDRNGVEILVYENNIINNNGARKL